MIINQQCEWCGLEHGPLCPRVIAVEYFPNGGIRRVELRAEERPGPDYRPTPITGVVVR